MTINKFNYEAYALDYLEGTLSPELQAEMAQFLKTHPTIDAELSGIMEWTPLQPDMEVVYEKKDQLLRKEKVVWLQAKWLRPLAVAASFALLFIGYRVGYKAGLQQESSVVQIERIKTEETANLASNDNKITNGQSPNELEQIDAAPVEENIQEIVTSPFEPSIERTSSARLSSVKKEFTNQPNNPKQTTPKKANQIANLTPLETSLKTVGSVETTHSINADSKVAAISGITPRSIQSNTQSANDLASALTMELPYPEEWLASVQKPKRKFKDLLGRFPVTNLKEALIPSYYRDEGEENTGQ
ncbi:MAG: hypothetical protein AAF960_18770 [Bacteroidota bacterium]